MLVRALIDQSKQVLRRQNPKFPGGATKKKDSQEKLKSKLNLTQVQGLPKDKLLAHLKVYKEQIYSQLRNAVMETGKQVQSDSFPNTYNVSYKGPLGQFLKIKLSPKQLLCDAKQKIEIETFQRGNRLFKKLQLDRFFKDHRKVSAFRGIMASIQFFRDQCLF